MKHLIAFALLAFAVGCGKQPATTTTTPAVAETPPLPATSAVPDVLYEVDADLLSAYFDENEVRAIRVFGDNHILVTGTVDRITARQAGPDVYLDGEPDDIVCEIAPSLAPEVEKMAKGQPASVFGRLFRSTFRPGLKDCGIITDEYYKPDVGGFLEFRVFAVSKLTAMLEELQQLRSTQEKSLELNRDIRSATSATERNMKKTIALIEALEPRLKKAIENRDAAQVASAKS